MLWVARQLVRTGRVVRHLSHSQVTLRHARRPAIRALRSPDSSIRWLPDSRRGFGHLIRRPRRARSCAGLVSGRPERRRPMLGDTMTGLRTTSGSVDRAREPRDSVHDPRTRTAARLGPFSRGQNMRSTSLAQGPTDPPEQRRQSRLAVGGTAVWIKRSVPPGRSPTTTTAVDTLSSFPGVVTVVVSDAYSQP
jgi:hypothetical protein